MRRLAPWSLVLTLGPAGAHAQDFFELSPGPLTHAHSELDSSDNCTKCHEIGKGVTDLLCLDCHQHQPLRDAIKAGRGLHAGFKQPCRVCHTEHKGRDAFVIDWGPLGGRAAFNHDKTGFPLTGQHAKANCTRCHKRTLRSGRSSYVDTLPDCDSCHKNPHAFANQELRQQCKACHPTPGVVSKLTPQELPFDHGERTQVALLGKHGTLECAQCHKQAKMTLVPGKARSCASCHKNPHGKTFKKWSCTECHSVTAKWRESSFDHDKTKFPLRGEHDHVQCSKCHKSKDVPPKSTCSSCHGDPHKKRFEKVACEKCHDKGGMVATQRFDHEAQAKFALTGKHQGLSCRSCHRGTGPREFERFDSGGNDCQGCHRHKNAHKGQFKDKNCLQCHVEGGNSDLVFDHQKDSRFALTGFHLQLGQERQCGKCHPQGQFRTNKLRCMDCHKDSHKGELGEDCAKCHQTDVHFKGAPFDHDRLSQFPLEGLHEKAECAKCHPERRYKLGKTACVDCHKKDDPHQAKLGEQCEKCHTPVKGAPKFDHEAMTEFARTGKHLEARCFTCHRPPIAPPPPIGWTAALPEQALDRHFPVMGTACAECHRDAHEGRYGTACGSCHETTNFKSARRAVHDTGAFRLMGAHDRVACGRCHTPSRQLSGLGVLCQGCHREDDVHQNALGPTCGDCHTQQGWAPQRFDHTRVGYVLRGQHKLAACRDCHGFGNFNTAPTDCATCHMPDAMQVVDPVHNGSLADCARCHSEVAFAPARRSHPAWTLTGVHATVRCSSCHVGGRYQGTPQDCVGCHMADFMDPGTQPSHVQLGFSTDCAACHTTTTFAGARYQHRNFLLRGTHRTLDCARCHPGEVYTGAFGGQVPAFECQLCHGPGGPVAREPQDHLAKGYPSGCELCHSELGWKPARPPR